MTPRPWTLFVAIALIGFTPGLTHAAKLVSVGVLDRDYLVVQVLDGDVAHVSWLAIPALLFWRRRTRHRGQNISVRPR